LCAPALVCASRKKNLHKTSFSGKGTFTWPYGAKYEGEYEGNKRNGHGVYVHADGRTYTGQYVDDRPHGKGVLTDPKGVVLHEGTWVNGQFMGE